MGQSYLGTGAARNILEKGGKNGILGAMNPVIRLRQMALLLGDVIVLYAALWATLVGRYGTALGTAVSRDHFEPFSILFPFWIASFYINNLYDLRRLKNGAAFLKNLAGAVTASTVISAVFFYLTTDYGIAPKTNLFIFLVFAFAFMCVWRSAYNRILRRVAPRTEVAMIGETSVMQEIAQAIRENPQLGYRMTDSVKDAELVIVPPSAGEEGKMAKRIYELATAGIEVTDSASFYEQVFKRLPIEELEPAWFLGHVANRRTIYDFVRTPVEMFCALALAIVLSPLLILIGLAVKLTSRGPAIFRQVRVGEYGKPFTLYKFRSMIANSPDGSAEAGTGAVWKTANDPRFTKVGRILERTHLDELPQLLNIMKGEASFVGPRPERPAFVAKLEEKIPYYGLRHLMKPGIAGWAQLNYKYGASEEDAYEKLRYDLYYLKNRSLWLDLSVILKTAKLFIAKNP